MIEPPCVQLKRTDEWTEGDQREERWKEGQRELRMKEKKMDYLLSDRLTLHLTRSREVERGEKREDGKTTDFSPSYSPSLMSLSLPLSPFYAEMLWKLEMKQKQKVGREGMRMRMMHSSSR